ncbi:MAG: hypothetical protein AAGB15_02795 [Pseudomonadota bacterium]
MMYQRHIAALLTAMTVAVTAPATLADGRDRLGLDRPSIGVPLSFAASDGAAFRPRLLVIHTAGGAVAADLPATSDDVRSEDRVDVSGTPLIGGLFRGRLAPSDARLGQNVGQVVRAGDSLHVEALGWPGRLGDFPVAFATRVRSAGTVSFGLGRLGYRAVTMAMPSGRVIGSAHIVNGKLVIASAGDGPPSLGDLFRSNF